MPWADASALSDGEQAAWENNRPAFVGNNILENYLALPQWRLSGSWASGTDITDTDYAPSFLGCDREAEAITRPLVASVTGQTDVYFICDLVAGTGAKYQFDCFTIIGHNFSEVGDVEVTLTISSLNTFANVGTNTFNLDTVAASSVSTYRFGSYELSDGTTDFIRPYNVRYLRLQVHRDGGFGAVAPAFGELWVGRRRLMSYKPRTPWDAFETESDCVDHVADGGQRTRYVKSAGRGIWTVASHAGGADVNGLSQNSEVRGWWTDCDHGSKPSLFWPHGKAQQPSIVYPTPRLSMPLVGPFEREFSIDLVESAPYVSQEV